MPLPWIRAYDSTLTLDRPQEEAARADHCPRSVRGLQNVPSSVTWSSPAEKKGEPRAPTEQARFRELSHTIPKRRQHTHPTTRAPANLCPMQDYDMGYMECPPLGKPWSNKLEFRLKSICY